jgi:hypothetical protein
VSTEKSPPEGFWAKVGAIAGVVSVIVAIIIAAVAGNNGGPPKPTEPPLPTTTSPPPPPPTTDTTTTTLGTPTEPSPAPPAPAEKYLDELLDAQVVRGPGGFDTGSYTVNGTTHARSVAFPTPCGQYPEVVDFVVSRQYGTFEAVIGLSDDSGAEAKAQFEVAADGARVGGPYVMTVGQHQEIHVNIRKPVKLRLTALNVGKCSNYFNENGIAVWGDARLVG